MSEQAKIIFGTVGGVFALGGLAFGIWWIVRLIKRQAVAEASAKQEKADAEQNKVANEKHQEAIKKQDDVLNRPIDPSDPWASVR